MDSDCVMKDDALQALWDCVQNHPEDIAFQLRLLTFSNTMVSRTEGLRLRAVQMMHQTGDGKICYANTSGFAVRSVFASIYREFFNPSLVRGEDTGILVTIREQGHLPRYVPLAVVYHCSNIKIFPHILENFWIGYHDGPVRILSSEKRIFLSHRQKIATLRKLCQMAIQEVNGVSTFLLLLLEYSFELLGRVFFSAIGMRPGRVRVLSGIVDPISENELMARIISSAEHREGKCVTYVNAWSLTRVERDSEFRGLCESFDICYADGIGVVLALMLTNFKRIKKVTANIFFLSLCEEAANRNLTVSFIGAKEGIAQKVASNICERLPNLNIILCSQRYLSNEQERDIEAELRRTKPAIVFVGRGRPIQERWVSSCKAILPGTVFFCVGGLFDYLSGNIQQTPDWIRGAGFEWLHRFCFHPKTYWRYYVIGIPLLVLDLIKVFLSKLFLFLTTIIKRN